MVPGSRTVAEECCCWSVSTYAVYADMRWPDQTGIGQAQKALMTRKPAQVSLTDLHVKGPIGSVLSTVAVSAALALAKPGDGLFLSAGFVPPILSKSLQSSTVHDLTHLTYYDKAKALYYNLLFKQLYHHCAAIVCSFEFTRREFIGWSGDPGGGQGACRALAGSALSFGQLREPGFRV